MKIYVFITLILIQFYVSAQSHDLNDQVILVQLELNEKLLVSSYWNSYEIENKRIMLHLSDDDPLSDIESIEEDEDQLQSFDCFIPSLKLIYKDYTYFISSLCNKVKKFENSKPFQTSEKELPCSLTYSSELSRSLEKYQAIFFGPTYKKDYNTFVQKNQSKLTPINTNTGSSQNNSNNLVQNQNSNEEEEVDNPEETEDLEEEEEDKTEIAAGEMENDEEMEDEEDIEEEEDDFEDEEEDKPKKKKK